MSRDTKIDLLMCATLACLSIIALVMLGHTNFYELAWQDATRLWRSLFGD